MKKTSYFRQNILEQCKEVTTGENLHEIPLGTDEASGHLSAQTHKYISTQPSESHPIFISSNCALHCSLTILINCYCPSNQVFIFISNATLGVASGFVYINVQSVRRVDGDLSCDRSVCARPRNESLIT